VTSLYYEIRVTGALPPEALLDFERLTMVQPVETVLSGLLPDQAALYGLLARLETLGVQVMEVRRLRDNRTLADLSAASGR
jgi:epsilon-lactone hydrolase